MKKNSTKKAVIILAIVFVLAIAAGVVAFFMLTSDSRQLAKQLTLANEYLEDGDYDEAIAAFSAALSIDPRCEETYLGIADAYIAKAEDATDEDALSFYREAIKVLEEGYDLTDSDELSDKIDDINELIEEIENKYASAGETTNIEGTVAAGESQEEEVVQLGLSIEDFTLFGMNILDAGWTYDNMMSLSAQSGMVDETTVLPQSDCFTYSTGTTDYLYRVGKFVVSPERREAQLLAASFPNLTLYKSGDNEDVTLESYGLDLFSYVDNDFSANDFSEVSSPVVLKTDNVDSIMAKLNLTDYMEALRSNEEIFLNTQFGKAKVRYGYGSSSLAVEYGGDREGEYYYSMTFLLDDADVVTAAIIKVQ